MFGRVPVAAVATELFVLSAFVTFGGIGEGRGGAGAVAWGPGSAMAAEGVPNACGCYQDTSGGCLCGKKARCGCPGQCEPKGCEEKREKQIRKEIEAETKKAQAAGRRYAQPGEKGAGRPATAAAGNGATSATDRTSAPTGERRAKAARMTATQKKELLRLLDLYAAERAAQAPRTVDQLRGELTAGAP